MLALSICGAVVSAPALAGQGAAAPGAAEAPAYRLTQAEVDRILAEAKERPDLPELALERDRRVHGEVGVEIGTGGYRSIYGTMGAPIGDHGGAAVSFEAVRGPRYDYLPGPYPARLEKR